MTNQSIMKFLKLLQAAEDNAVYWAETEPPPPGSEEAVKLGFAKWCSGSGWHPIDGCRITRKGLAAIGDAG